MQKQELIRSVVEMVGLNIMEKSMAYNLIEKITLNEKQSKYKTILRGEDKPLVKRNDRKTKHPKWSEEDTNFLKENYANFSGKEIGAKLNRTRQSINQRVLFLRKTGVDIPKKIKGNSSWTEREQMFLEQFHNKYSINEIAKKLNRSTSVIYSKIQKIKEETNNEQNDLNGN